jgi:type I restriction enzyme S subunit
MSNALTNIDNKPSLRANHCEDEGRRNLKQSHPLVPALRFKEFDGDYRIVNVNDCIEFLTDYHANGSYERLKENVELLAKEDYAIMIRTTNFEKKDFQNNLLYISEHAYNYLKKSKVLGDDIIINKIANAGATYIMPHLNRPVSLAMNLFMLRTNSSNSGKYIYYKIRNKEFRLRALSSGTGTKTITKQDVKTFKLEIPDLPEQQKIASFLSAVDEKIQQLTKKKALLEQYKKGLMQKLFSGQLRFKDENGKDYPDWEEKLLGKLVKICSSKRVLQEDWKEEGIPFLRTREIINLSNNVGFKTPIFITNELFEELKLKYGVPKSGDILATGVGTIGQLYIVNKADKFYFKDGNVIWFKMNDSLDSNYLNQLFKTRFIRKQLNDNASITTVATFTIDGARKTKIIYPCIEEQQKIATYLSGIDTKIGAVTHQITQTQTFKKGLLQQMFV